MAIPVPIDITQGETTALLQSITLSDVTGWSFAAQIRSSAASPEVLAEWTPEQLEAHPYALILPIDPETSSSWTWSRGVLGIEARTPEGQVIRIMQHPVTLNRELVRPYFAGGTA